MKLTYLAFPLLLLSSSMAHAGPGHDHGHDHDVVVEYSGDEPIQLSETAIHNLDIQTQRAERKQLDILTTLYGVVVPDPKRHLKLSARFSGRVSDIRTALGSKVQSGDPLLTVEPQQIGSVPVTFKAPFAGVITAQHMNAIGQSFTSEQTLLELVDSSEVLVRGQTFEGSQAAKLKVNQKVYVQSPLDKSNFIEGTLERVPESIDPESLSFDVYARIKNPENSLLINARVILKIAINSFSNRLVIPTASLLGDTGNYFVFVRDKNNFQKRQVKIGVKNDKETEILKGVKVGESVVTRGHYQLQYAPAKKPNAGSNPEPNQADHGHDHGDHGHDHGHEH